MTTKKTAATTVKAPAKKAPTEKIAAPAIGALTIPAAAKPAREVSASETPPKKTQATVPAAPAKATALAEKTASKKSKHKVVRDSFTMPQSEYQKIALIKELCLKAGLPVKKSEVLRAGLNALCEMDAAQLKRALGGLEKIKTGRPKEYLP